MITALSVLCVFLTIGLLFALVRLYIWKCIAFDLQVELDAKASEMQMFERKVDALSHNAREWEKHAAEARVLRLQMLAELTQAKKLLLMRR